MTVDQQDLASRYLRSNLSLAWPLAMNALLMQSMLIIDTDGMFHASDAPGLGVDFDEKEADRYSYERRYHPVVRLEDGALWNY